jgi:glycosyltransferase involved in cell wall biosynthesis
VRGLGLIFCSDFPVGFHNPEAEEKARRLAGLGFDVRYVAKLGIANPRPRAIVQRLVSQRSTAAPTGVDVVSPRLLPPRHTFVTSRLNVAWLRRQVLDSHAPADTVLWLRFPTPELVPLVEAEPWRLIVYEVVDDHPNSPGMTRALRRRYLEAERRILAKADVVFTWSPKIRDRLVPLAPRVDLLGPVTDVERLLTVERTPRPRSALYVGGLDFRVNAALLADVAAALPDWTFTFAGAILDERLPAALARPNVEMLGRVHPSEVPRILSCASVAMLPFRRTAFTASLSPIKLVEYLAAGVPVVSTRFADLEPLTALVRLADDAAAFGAALVSSAAEDGPAAAEARRRAAAPFSWEVRMSDVERRLEEALAGL